jgi:hypothetical protein
MRLPRRLVGPGLFAIAFGLSLCPGRLEAFREADVPGLPDLDRRLGKLTRVFPLPAQVQARQELRSRVQGLEVAFDPLLGTHRWIGSPHGFLSGPNGQGRAIAPETIRRQAPADPYRIVKAFLDEHHALFDHGPDVLETGRIKREFITPHSGLRTVVWEQQLDGIPIFQSVLIVHLTKKGELVSFSSRFLSDPDRAAQVGGGGQGGPRDPPRWTPTQAVVAAAQNLGINVDPAQVSPLDPEPIGLTRRQRFQALGLAGPVTSQLVWLPVHRNSLRLCYDIVASHPLDGHTYQLILDATTGQAWVRTDLTQNLTDATYRVFTSDSPSPFSPGHSVPLTNQPAVWPRTSETIAALDTNASPNGWINDGVYVTQGNNVRAHLDRDANNVPDLPLVQGTTNRVFSFSMDPTRHPTNYGAASVVQLFYWCNWMHDTLYGLGFTEAAGNFQVNNFGRGGQGNDAVEADAQDGFELNNARMTTLPEDGTAPGNVPLQLPHSGPR